VHRLLPTMCVLVLVACGQLQAGSQGVGLASHSPATVPSATPWPTGVVDPQPLIAQVTRLNGFLLRVDDVGAKLVSIADYTTAATTVGPDVRAPATLWVVAVVGDIRQGRGLLPRANSQCRLSAFWADTGKVWSVSEGPLALCQPYFARSLTPPDAPVRCTSDTYDNGVSPDQRFSRTRPGSFGFVSIRDDSWRQPTTVRGVFLAQAPETSVPYQQAFCLNSFTRRGPTIETLLASGVGASAPSTMPALEWAIWLRGYHAVSGSSDDAGHVDVILEPRAGYEWAFFDWHALVPDGGYVVFRFRDAAGNEILPWRLANGP
jgi:hypothetical protein